MDSRNDPSQNIALSVARLLAESKVFQSGRWEVYIQIPFWCLELSDSAPLHAPYTGKTENEGALDLLVCRDGKAALGVSLSAYEGGEIELPGLPTLELTPIGYSSLALHPDLIPWFYDDMIFSAGAIIDALVAHSNDVLTRPFQPWDGDSYLPDGARGEDLLQRLHLVRDGRPTQFGAACGVFRQVLPKTVRWLFHPASRSMALSMLLGLGRLDKTETVPLAVRKARLAAGWPSDHYGRVALARTYGDLLRMNIDQLCARHEDASPTDLADAVGMARKVLQIPPSTTQPVLWDMLNLLHSLRVRYDTGGEAVRNTFDDLLLGLLHCFLPLNARASGVTYSRISPEPKIQPSPIPEDQGPVSLEQRLRRFRQDTGLIKQFSEMPIFSYYSALCAYTGTLYPMWLMQTRIWPKPAKRDATVGTIAVAANKQILKEFQEDLDAEDSDLPWTMDGEEEEDVAPPYLPLGRQMAYDLLAETLFPSPDLLT